MINVRDAICEFINCTTLATFGDSTSKKKKYCAKHKDTGMVNVKDKKCEHKGCVQVVI